MYINAILVGTEEQPHWPSSGREIGKIFMWNNHWSSYLSRGGVKRSWSDANPDLTTLSRSAKISLEFDFPRGGQWGLGWHPTQTLPLSANPMSNLGLRQLSTQSDPDCNRLGTQGQCHLPNLTQDWPCLTSLGHSGSNICPLASHWPSPWPCSTHVFIVSWNAPPTTLPPCCTHFQGSQHTERYIQYSRCC